ncbi:zinc-binding dehydrogenase [Gracilibacillus alcaliphilus]|uniref:zinc-binding dehydrogenase n=1 Tax=Gracilibacillus alcaliphilus TaxID=1401441 RepID=UPI0019569FE9|nr:zinc-binding dehydrogenase [Gracilibacillus alcaliphilus]MBM7679357.1 zinc-binding alcohol dehydrogenase/oxidoreductase [Gracilibacillus alcaliphilus]
MKAYTIQHGKQQLTGIKVAEPQANEIVISLKAAGLNHRDLMMKGRIGNQPNVYTLGSDGAGIVEKVGANVSRFQAGDEVIINPSLNWYHNTAAPPSDFAIFDGSFAEKAVVSEEFLERKPSHLSWEEAGVFALSGLTGYRALITLGQIKAGETLFVPGVGGGVVSYIIQMAKAVGARVITASRDQKKLEQAEQLGFDRAVLTDDNWEELLADETIDLVIETIGGATFNRSLSVLKKGGRIVIFGSSTHDEISFNLRDFFYGHYQLFGSTMGSREELRELMAFSEKYNIKPLIDKTYSLTDIEQAFDYLSSQAQLGKVAITI